MQISPRYDADPIITIDGPVDSQRTTVVRQRRRLESLLAGLSDEQWRSPSRCEDWSVHDVVSHLITTNTFWTMAVQAGLAGEPTRVLDGFDPKATPAAIVDATPSATPAETFAEFAATNTAFCTTLDGLDRDGWGAIAEAPCGHVPVNVVAHHALWDSLVHERDIALPLGLSTVDEPDEIEASLRYATALGPALFASRNAGRRGTIALVATAPELNIVVDVGESMHVRDGAPPDGALVLKGTAIDLLDIMSVRAPLDQSVPDDQRWLIEGLGAIFESQPA
jgi:uncharacterized protein (TIGR03083 family)